MRFPFFPCDRLGFFNFDTILTIWKLQVNTCSGIRILFGHKSMKIKKQIRHQFRKEPFIWGYASRFLACLNPLNKAFLSNFFNLDLLKNLPFVFWDMKLWVIWNLHLKILWIGIAQQMPHRALQKITRI